VTRFEAVAEGSDGKVERSYPFLQTSTRAHPN